MKSIRCLKAFFLSLSLFISLPAWAEMTLKEMKQKAEQGDAHAQYLLGQEFFFGDKVAKDLDKAADWLTKSGNQGHASAIIDLITVYAVHKRQPEDMKKAEFWMAKLSKLDDVEAQMSFGNASYIGFVVEENPEKAYHYFSKVYGKHSYYFVYSALGELYLNGRGTIQNFRKSYIAYSLATALGDDPDDVKARDRVASYIYGDPIVEAQEEAEATLKKIKAFNAAR